MSAPTRATITITIPAVQQGQASKGSTVDSFQVQFNPKEYSISKSATWDHKPSTSADSTAMPEFKGANSAELTFELFLDATQTKGGPDELVKRVDQLFFCCSPLVKTKQQKKPSAPFVVLEWGKLKFTGNVKSVAAKYTLFNEKGEPLRATCNVTLQELPTASPSPTPRRAVGSRRRATGWWRATPWPRSHGPSTRTRPCGGSWRWPTTSTTRSASGRGRSSSCPRRTPRSRPPPAA